jgi:hypothetical protein
MIKLNAIDITQITWISLRNVYLLYSDVHFYWTSHGQNGLSIP